MLPLLSQLWLNEPDAPSLEAARQVPELAPHCDQPAALAQAYTELLLLNVYPYAGVFLDQRGELNGERAREVEAFYEQHHFSPPELSEVAAPDHIGLMLAALESIGAEGTLPYLLDWAPVFCLAVEREPGVLGFYTALAALTRKTIFSLAQHIAATQAPPRPQFHTSTPLLIDLAVNPDDETSARDVNRWLLVPARSGLFLSRSRLGWLARGLGVALPFGDRFQVGLGLLEAAGGTGQVGSLIELLKREVGAWDAAYAAWALECPDWAAFGAQWRERVAETSKRLNEMATLAAGESDSLGWAEMSQSA